jgi:hypothetical protein
MKTFSNAMTIVGAIFGACLATCGANAEDLLIRSARVHTVAAPGTLEQTDVLVRNGKIAAIGSGIAAAGAKVIEAGNRPLTPGFYAGLANIGVTEVYAESTTSDSNISFAAPAWQQQWRPEFDVTRAYNPRSVVLPVARIEGLTWTVLSPRSGDSIISGQGAAVTLDGRYDAVLNGSRTLFASWSGPSAASGGSRAAQYMLLEQAIREVRSAVPAGDQALLHPAGREALSAYLAGGRVVFSVERAADIHALITFAQRYRMKPVIHGGSEAWLVADELARAAVPVILNPLENLPDNFNKIGARLDNAARLHAAGVRIAFSADDVHNASKIRQLAGNAVAHGLPWDAALAAVTAAPAEIFGLGASRGHIVVGQSADLVLWSGDPLEVTSLADQVWIAGRAIEMRSRQSELRDRYFKRSSMQ